MRRRIKGTVVSDKMDKTLVVAVTHTRRHPKYHKEYKVTQRFKVHDPKNAYKVGDEVVIETMRPLSRLKRWRVIEVPKS